MSLLQRACAGLDQTTGLNAGSAIESQTLRMGMGLVSALLSEPQVCTSD